MMYLIFALKTSLNYIYSRITCLKVDETFNNIFNFYVSQLNLVCLLKIVVLLHIYVTLYYPFCLNALFKSKYLHEICIMYSLFNLLFESTLLDIFCFKFAVDTHIRSLEVYKLYSLDLFCLM